MTTSKSQQAKEQFLFSTPPINPDSDLNFVEIAQTSNINNFSHHVSYLANMVIGGKLKPEDAYKEIKKLYKALKHSHKSLNGSWF
jgi:hypothetical protein